MFVDPTTHSTSKRAGPISAIGRKRLTVLGLELGKLKVSFFEPMSLGPSATDELPMFEIASKPRLRDSLNGTEEVPNLT